MLPAFIFSLKVNTGFPMASIKFLNGIKKAPCRDGMAL
jgi:hypothetical protein